MNTRHAYIRDGAAIYERSFAIIRTESDLSRFSGTAERVVVRMIHACGMTDLPRDVAMSPDFADAAEAALARGAPILCDARMVAEGITRPRLPANNQVICTLHDAGVPELARELGNTRSAVALEHWREHLEGSVVVIGKTMSARLAVGVQNCSWTTMVSGLRHAMSSRARSW